MAVSTSRRSIAFIGFNGMQALDLVGPVDVFSGANAEGAGYQLHIASQTGGDITTNAGLTIAGAAAINELPDHLDTIVVAGGGREALQQAIAERALLDWLRVRATSTRRIASVCTGAFVLAAAGLLDGRRATTHWGSCARLQAWRPAIRLEPDAIFVADPPFYTSAGVTAGIDLALSLVEDDLGPAIALAVARDLVLFMRRPGGQTQFSPGLGVQAAATPRLRALVAEVSADPNGDLSLPALADRVGMSERTFSRAFRREVGLTPAAFVEIARIDRAKALLETSDWPLARVAERAGFRSLDALHRAFLKRVSTTPGAYREHFGRAAQRSGRSARAP